MAGKLRTMKRLYAGLIAAAGVLGVIGGGGCSTPEPTAAPAKVAGKPDAAVIAPLHDKPLYQFSEREVDAYLRHLSATEPDLRKRIIHLARKNLAQPYELYLLGEAPFEQTDPQPIYCLDRSDCVVFAEHTLAMALSKDFPSFMSMLQRIRYKRSEERR